MRHAELPLRRCSASDGRSSPSQMPVQQRHCCPCCTTSLIAHLALHCHGPASSGDSASAVSSLKAGSLQLPVGSARGIDTTHACTHACVISEFMNRGWPRDANQSSSRSIAGGTCRFRLPEAFPSSYLSTFSFNLTVFPQSLKLCHVSRTTGKRTRDPPHGAIGEPRNGWSSASVGGGYMHVRGNGATADAWGHHAKLLTKPTLLHPRS